jgi:putative Mg2+ transporter-C (MgtC) family protein
MTLHPDWAELALRLALTVVASLLLGFNRSQHGKAAGMTTTLLVGLAAAVSMIEVNLLLSTGGRQSDSFVMNDLMRLPLGILTGVGFIGAGAILRRKDIVVGVTTAATLWLITVIGLVLGGGQIHLGLAATALGLFALWGVKGFESLLRQEHTAHLSIECDNTGPGESEILRRLEKAGAFVVESSVLLHTSGNHAEFGFLVKQVRHPSEFQAPDFIAELAKEQGVIKLGWRMSP